MMDAAQEETLWLLVKVFARRTVLESHTTGPPRDQDMAALAGDLRKLDGRGFAAEALRELRTDTARHLALLTLERNSSALRKWLGGAVANGRVAADLRQSTPPPPAMLKSLCALWNALAEQLDKKLQEEPADAHRAALFGGWDLEAGRIAEAYVAPPPPASPEPCNTTTETLP